MGCSQRRIVCSELTIKINKIQKIPVDLKHKFLRIKIIVPKDKKLVNLTLIHL